MNSVLLIVVLTFASVIGIEGFMGDRIVGGTETDISLHKHIVSLRKYGVPFCAGSIITPTCILTAAHCTDNVSPEHLSVRGGFTDHSETKEVIGQASKIFSPDNYNRYTIEMDVSLIVLEKPIVGQDIRSIEMSSEPLQKDSLLILAGWGRTSEQGTTSRTLKQTFVRFISRHDCATNYGYDEDEIKETMFCGVTPKGAVHTDSCAGDSGGPVVADGKLRGIVSWGIGCALEEYPGVYTSMAKDSKAYQWVNMTVNDHCFEDII